MITMDMVGKIRRLHSRGNKSEREIARETGLSRNTVAKWLKAPVVGAPKYRRGPMALKLTPFVAAIEQALQADARRPRKERRTAKAIFKELAETGYGGGYSRLTDFIREWRGRQDGAGVVKAFVPLIFEMGEAFQFDWSEEPLVVGGIYRKLQVSHMKLCASRAFWLVAYPSQSHEMLFDAHTRSFAALGGIPQRGIYDNMKTAVDKVKKGKGRVVNARFSVMCAHYLYDPDFCNVASGWEKGIVEKNVQDSRRRIWIEASKRKWSDLVELNAWLATRCRELWSEIRHPEHPQFSVAEMLELEREQMMPMTTPFDGYVEEVGSVRTNCLVSVARNRYSVPCELVGQSVSKRLYPTRVVIVAADRIVADHERLNDKGKVRYDWQHYIPLLERKPGALRNGAPFVELPAPLQRMRKALLREPGGDRLMVKILALVPSAGLEHVLVAVELALERVPPSGRISEQHVINVLARLNAEPRPANVQTRLQLSMAPTADTARYDRLRNLQEVDHDGDA